MAGGDARYRSKPLSDLCELLNGLAFKPTDWTERGTPIIRIQNLNGAVEFNYYARKISSEYVIPPGTILFSWSGNRGTSFGPFVWAGPTGVVNQHIFKVTPKPGVNRRWLYHALSIARATAERAAHGGSGLVHVRRGDLLSYSIPAPSSVEQHRIAEILDTADESISGTEAVIAKLRLCRLGLADDVLSRGVDQRGCCRGHEEKTEFVHSELGVLPPSWMTPTFEGITTPDAPICYGILQPGVDVPEGVPTVAIHDLDGDFRAPLHRTHPAIERRYVRSRVMPGDVLLSVKGSTGRVAIVPSGLSGNISRDVARIRVRPSILGAFVAHMLQARCSQRRLERAIVGTTRSEISIGVLRRLHLPLPPIEEQHRIVAVLDAADARVRTEEAYLAKLKLVKQGLMQDLLTGRIRVAA